MAAGIAAAGLAGATARRAIDTLVRLMRCAERDGILAAGTADTVRLPSAMARTDPKRLTSEEVRLVIKTLVADARVENAYHSAQATALCTVAPSGTITVRASGNGGGASATPLTFNGSHVTIAPLGWTT